MVQALRHTRIRASLAAALALSLLDASVLTSTAQTDIQPPTIVSHSPDRGASGLPDAIVVTATFSEPVEPSSVSFLLRTSTNAVVPALTTYDPSTSAVVLSPLEPLASGTYTAVVAEAMDSAGNVLAGPIVWSFAVSTPDADGAVAQSELAGSSLQVAAFGGLALALLSLTTFTEAVQSVAVMAGASSSDEQTAITSTHAEAPSASINVVAVITAVNPVSASDPAASDVHMEGSLDLASNTDSPEIVATASVSELPGTTVAPESGAVSTSEIPSEEGTSA